MSKAALVELALGLMILMSFTGQCYGTGRDEFHGGTDEFRRVSGAVQFGGDGQQGGSSALQFGFYAGKCNGADVEAIVGGVIAAWIKKDLTIVAALLRMQFHDCFVKGCDASILLDGSNSEKTAPPNLSVRGFEIIDAAKAAVEAKCPGVVSCADIIVMAARDTVFWSGGGRYAVQTGRKDGLISLAQNVNLPAPSISVPDSITAFANKGLGVEDMVYLLGGHTVGVAHCSLFQNRLYNFQNTGMPDQTMDPVLLAALRQRCPQNATVNNVANLDQNPNSAFIVDNSYFQQIQKKRGVLQIDQELALDQQTMGIVANAARGSNFPTRFSFDQQNFRTRFAQAMVRLGAVQVLTGPPGEIRKSCRVVNNSPQIGG